MAHGTPDWGVTAGAVTTYQLTDLGELAARLGSIVTHDRRGDVMFLDSFEDGLGKWAVGGSGTLNAVDLSRARTRKGPYSARLVAGSGDGTSAHITHSHAFPVLSRMGFEFSFSYEDVLNSVELIVHLYDGTYRTVFRVDWVDTDNTIVYLDSIAAPVVLATGVDLRRTPTLFHTMKLVVDAAAREYLRLILDESEYSMADIAGQQVLDGTAPHFTVQLCNNGAGVANFPVYAADVILTQNEPA